MVPRDQINLGYHGHVAMITLSYEKELQDLAESESGVAPLEFEEGG